MPYNNPSPSQSTTLTAAERSKEARRILEMLREEPEEDLERKLSARAQEFVSAKWLEMDLGGQLNVTPDQYWWLQDLWSRFA
jgi:hypothetical protein